MVESEFSKLVTRVRFPPPAPLFSHVYEREAKGAALINATNGSVDAASGRPEADAKRRGGRRLPPPAPVFTSLDGLYGRHKK